MIIEKIRKKIRTCGKSRYQISMATKTEQAVLLRIMRGGDCKTKTADALFKYFGLTVAKKAKKKTRVKK